MSNESVFFTQKTTPTRAFLRNCTRAKSQSIPVNQSVVQVIQSSQTIDVYSFGHSVDSVDSIQSKSDLINRYVYYDTRAFIYQIGSQNLNKIKAILILSDVTSVCDYTKLLENI